MTPLTPAQKRALSWLPADGGWSGPLSSNGNMRLYALSKHRPDLVESQFTGSRFRYRLTQLGIAEFPFRITLKAEMEKSDAV